MSNERRDVPVHPNSTAARKWGRKTWTTSEKLYARASRAEKQGNTERANALRRAAAKAGATAVHCG